VHLDVQIREDGAATGVRLVGPSVNRRLEAAEMGPVSLYVYSPLRVCGCPAETVIRLELPEEPIVVVVPGR